MKEKSKFIAGIGFLAAMIVLVSMLLAAVIYFVYSSITNTSERLPMTLSAGAFLCFIIYLLCYTNRVACIVWIDHETNELCRKGLFYGYKYRMKIDEVTYVFQASRGGGVGDLPIVVTDSNSRLRKDVLKRAIEFEPNGRNKAFIEKMFGVKYEELEMVSLRCFKKGNYDGTFIR